MALGSPCTVWLPQAYQFGMKSLSIALLSLSLLMFPLLGIAQQKINFNLAKLYAKGQLAIVGRTAKVVKEGKRTFLQLAEDKGEGLVWLPMDNFSKGKLQITMRGKDVLQRSFVGIAFHGTNDSTYDAVYCRPFNFYAQDSVRRIHAIQYVAHPVFTWKKLREQQNAVFEKAIAQAPDPNDWFTMTLVVTDTTVAAYINQSPQPALVVQKLSNQTSGKLGIFMGDGSGGDFVGLRMWLGSR
jgi:hypothetical protein